MQPKHYGETNFSRSIILGRARPYETQTTAGYTPESYRRQIKEQAKSDEVAAALVHHLTNVTMATPLA